MKNVIEYIKNILSDTAGSPSSKRVVTVLFSLLIAVAFVANLFFGYSVDKELIDSVMYIVIAWFGFTGVEKFAPNGIAGRLEAK